MIALEEMSLERLLDKIYEVGKKVDFDHSNGESTQDLRLYNREIKQEILTRFSTLEEKVKGLEERNDALNKCLEINQDDYAKMKSFNEKQNASLKTQVEGLKCCGNCTGWKEAGLCLDAGCDADGCCDNWQSTILTKGERHE